MSRFGTYLVQQEKKSTMISFFSFILNRQKYKLKIIPPRCENTKYCYIMLYIYINLQYTYTVHTKNTFLKCILFSLQINKGKNNVTRNVACSLSAFCAGIRKCSAVPYLSVTTSYVMTT